MKTPINSVNNCHFELHTSANEHTRDAVVALAQAAEANARAIEAAAAALANAGNGAVGVSIRSGA